MKFTELKDSIKEGAKSVYLLEGDDAYFRKSGEEMIKSAFLQMPELNFTAFDGETLKGGGYYALVSAAKNYPFMAEKRIIRVSEMYPSESEYETYLKPLLEDFPETTILIIVNSGAKKGADLKRKKNVTYVNCNKAEPETVARWIYITLKRAGVRASSELCELIASYCLSDMARVFVETNKIIAYKGDGELTREEVDTLVFKDAEYRLYELTGTVPRRNFTAFCTIADEIMKKGGDELMILNGLFNYFKTLLTVLSSSANDASLAEKLKMKEYGVKKSREQAAQIGEERLKNYIGAIYSNISDIKTGKITPQSAYLNARAAIFFA